MKQCIFLFLIFLVTACGFHSKRSQKPDSSQPPDVVPPEKPGVLSQSSECLPVMGWNEAIYGTKNTRTMAEVFTQPRSEHSMFMVKKAKNKQLICL
jgi:hypothetical protein